jgi:hypothetical protein
MHLTRLRGLFCNRFEGDTVSYPCCQGGAAWTCAQNAPAAVQQPVEQQAYTEPVPQLREGARPETVASTAAAADLPDAPRLAPRGEPRTVEPAAAAATAPAAAPAVNASGSGGSPVRYNLTSALIDGMWVARNNDNATGASAEEECMLLLELDDSTGDITAVAGLCPE